MANELFNIGRLLIENKEKKYSIREISLERKINYKSAYQAVMKLEKTGIAVLERSGNVTHCSFSGRFDPLVYEVEYARRADFLKKKDFKVLYSRLNELPFPIISLVYGSYAKGKQQKGSDIDLLAVSDARETVERAISLIPMNIHLTLFSYAEFSSMLLSKEYNVVSEAVKNNIILAGIEEYYRLTENAGRKTG